MKNVCNWLPWHANNRFKGEITIKVKSHPKHIKNNQKKALRDIEISHNYSCEKKTQ